MDEIQKRGAVSARIKARSKELMGEEITTTELRLLPFLQYVLVNSQRVSPEKVNQGDKDIMSKWVEKGYILDGVTQKGRPMLGSKLKVTKEFWGIMLELIWLGYVDLDS